MRESQAFMKNYKLLISTLSPVHMGSGEDYDPTNYVLDGEMLYGFETTELASSVLSKAEKEELRKLVETPRALQDIQSFIYKLRDRIVGIASHTVSVSAAVSAKYLNRVGKVAQREGTGKNQENALEINRNAFNYHSQHPLLPGSGLKGAIRTAFLNQLNSGVTKVFKNERIRIREALNLENKLLGIPSQGEFQYDPMRLLKISDAAWQEVIGNPSPRILFDTNIPKDKERLGKEPKPVMLEVIPAMISQGFSAQLNLLSIADLHASGVPRKQIGIEELVKACNDYYLSLFKSELEILESLNCLDKDWLTLIKDILSNELSSLIRANKAILLRVGRHTSAEGITIEGARSIEIPQRKNSPSRYGNKTATTLWLAGEREKAKENLQPFGWILIELNPDLNDKVSLSLAEKMLTFNHGIWAKESELKQSIISKRAEIEQLRSEQLATERQRQTEKEEQEKREAAKNAALAAMSTDRRAVQRLIDEMELGIDRGKGAGCQLASEAAKLIESAVSWSTEDKGFLLELIPVITSYLNIDIKRNDKWKTRIRKLNHESN